MAQYDGSIRINTKINTSEASSQLMSLENRMVKAADRIASLQAKMDALKDVQIPTQEYKSIESDIARANRELGNLLEKQAQMQNEGKDSGANWERLNMRIQATKDYIAQAQAEMQELINSGKAFTLGSESEEYARLSQQLQYAQNDLEILNQRHKELSQRQAENRRGYNRLGKSAKDGANTAGKAVKGMSDALKVGFKNILKYGLGIRSIYALVNKIRNGIKEGFSNFSEYSSSFKDSIDSLKGSFLTLKNSFAAAFSPIVQTVIPYIQKLIDYLSQLFSMIGRFIALARGQETYTKAIKQTTGAIKDQNKAQNRQLSSLDKLNNMTSDKGDEDNSAGTMFEEVPVDKELPSILQKVVEYAQELKDIFMQGFFDGLGDWQYRWDSIKDSIHSIKDSLIDIFTDPAVLAAADGWAQSVAYMLGSLVGSTASIGLTIATNIVGGIAKYLEQNKERIKGYLIDMFDIWEYINYLFAELFQSIAYVFEAFASEKGQQLTANLIGIFVNAFMGLTEIASKLIRDILNIIIQLFVDNKEAFQESLESFLGVLAEVTGTIKDGIDETFDKLNEVYDEHFKPFFDSIANGLSDTIGKFMEFWNGSVQPILDEFAEKFDVLWKEHIQPVLNSFIELLGSVADYFKAVYEQKIKPLVDLIIQYVFPAIAKEIDKSVDVLMWLFGIVADVVGGIIDVFKGILDFIVGVFTGDWEHAWEGIVDTFKAIFNTIVDVVESVINGAIGIINKLIGGINNITVNIGIPSIPDIPEVSIPRLATGTVVPPNREFMAVLGDNKREPEVVSPLSTMKQASKEALLEALSEVGLPGTNNSGSNIYEFSVDGQVFFRIMEKYAQEYKKQHGGKIAFT
ncbi:MAG: hypothetical protein NC548_35580 [Lachnospiraceae bacterium]|nr:hypothetical protein [Lachnospiraceae bacterium]MCM1232708.1 hypothetical protein [Ruminococcus flavefaciens]